MNGESFPGLVQGSKQRVFDKVSDWQNAVQKAKTGENSKAWLLQDEQIKSIDKMAEDKAKHEKILSDNRQTRKNIEDAQKNMQEGNFEDAEAIIKSEQAKANNKLENARKNAKANMDSFDQTKT